MSNIIISTEKLEEFKTVLPNLEKGEELSHQYLDAIKDVNNQQDRDAAIERLVVVKKIHDKLKNIREPYTKYLDETKQQIMSFERASDYSDKKSKYSEKRALIEAFDQAELQRKKEEEAKAEVVRQTMIHKGEVKEGVQRALIEMMAGQKKNVIQGMASWEASLNLENIEAKEKGLTMKTPALDRKKYEDCFHLPAFPKMQKEWYEECFVEWKKELPYEKYNEEYVQMIVPIINEYKARIPEIRVTLQQLSAEAAAKREEELKQQALEAVKKVDVEVLEKVEEVKNENDLNRMEAEFTKQGMTQDLDMGPKERVITFEKGQFLKPFSEIIGHCVTHPDFPGIFDAKGGYRKEVQWWLDFYSKKIFTPVKGIVIEEKAKTTIRKTTK